MKTNLKILIFLLLSSAIYAQSDSILRLRTDSFDIYYSKGDKTIDTARIPKAFASEPPAVLSAQKIEYLKDTSLVLRSGAKLQKINVNDLKSVKFYHGTQILNGMLAGVGFALFSVMSLYELSGDSSITGFIRAVAVGFVVAIPLSVIGGIIGIFVKHSHSYNISGLTPEKKTEKLIRLFRQHRN